MKVRAEEGFMFEVALVLLARFGFVKGRMVVNLALGVGISACIDVKAYEIFVE